MEATPKNDNNRQGPSDEDIAKAVAMLKAELEGNRDAIVAMMNEEGDK